METLPRWGRVVRVGRRVFGRVSVDVEIHYGRTPPHVEPVSVPVPRGMQLQVGQDVFVVGPDTSSDSSDVDPRRDAATAVRELADAARVPPGRAAGGGLACGRAAGFA